MNVTYDVTHALRAQAKQHEPCVLESNQNHAQIYHDGITPTLPAAMGMGGGYVPMIVTPKNTIAYGLDSFNQNIDHELSFTLRTNAGGDTLPKVLILWNGKADGAEGKGLAFAVVGDHENRPTDMTNLVIQLETET